MATVPVMTADAPGNAPLSDAEVAIAAATVGALAVRREYGARTRQIAGSTNDVATAADYASEHAILSLLARHRPADGREGEETGVSGNDAAHRRWLVDPLYGTANFAATTPLACVNVALTVDHDVMVAACADPISGELFWTDGAAAWRREEVADEPIRPAASSRLVDVNCDGPPGALFVGGQLLGDPELLATWNPRVVSTTLALAWVAAGRRAAYITDGRLEGNVHFAAGIGLCRAAGCAVTDLAGGPLHSGRGLIAAADAATHADMVRLVRPHLDAVLSH